MKSRKIYKKRKKPQILLLIKNKTIQNIHENTENKMTWRYGNRFTRECFDTRKEILEKEKDV